MSRGEVIRRIKEAEQMGSTHLDLSNLAITNLPLDIEALIHLESLDLSYNKFDKLSRSVSNLKRLERLYLRGTPLEKLPDKLPIFFPHLKYLDVSDCTLKTLPEDIAGLGELEELYASNNQLQTIPLGLVHLTRLQKLDLRGNPRLGIPRETLELVSRPVSILDLIKDRAVQGGVKLNEVKVLIVGQPGVGKTAVVKRLTGNIFDNIRIPTEGINIHAFPLPLAGNDVNLYLWDFGGQEIMHATHQFFLTNRSLYLLVLDATLEEQGNQLEYWLRMIQTFGGGSPIIIIIINKIDQRSLFLDQRGLHLNYPLLQGVVNVSCATNEGFNVLRAQLQKALMKVPGIGGSVPASWVKVKQRIQAMRQDRFDYLEYGQFRQTCLEEGINPDNTDSVADLLHQLGTALHYKDIRLHTYILNPNWVTKGIYAILNSSIAANNKGKVTWQEITMILSEVGYPKEKHGFITTLMENFEVAFETKKDEYLIPDLLSKEAPPNLAWNKNTSIGFQYQYKFLPTNIFSRFIYHIRTKIDLNHLWRYGAVLKWRRQPYALVEVNQIEKEIHIWVRVAEKQHDSRTLLDDIRDAFEEIHRTFAGLEVIELVPIRNAPKHRIPYSDLLDLEAQGINHHYLPRIGKVQIKELLDGISEESSRVKRQETEIEVRRLAPLSAEERTLYDLLHARFEQLNRRAKRGMVGLALGTLLVLVGLLWLVGLQFMADSLAILSAFIFILLLSLGLWQGSNTPISPMLVVTKTEAWIFQWLVRRADFPEAEYHALASRVDVRD